MASLIRVVYMLELDRQENRTQENALAPSWWIPFKYKLTQILIDERDGSIFAAIFEWDRSAALVDFLAIRPNGVPKASFVLRKWVSHMYSNNSDYISIQLQSLYSSTPFQVSHLFNENDNFY